MVLSEQGHIKNIHEGFVLFCFLFFSQDSIPNLLDSFVSDPGAYEFFEYFADDSVALSR